MDLSRSHRRAYIVTRVHNVPKRVIDRVVNNTKIMGRKTAITPEWYEQWVNVQRQVNNVQRDIKEQVQFGARMRW